MPRLIFRKSEKKGWDIDDRGQRVELSNYIAVLDGKPIAEIRGCLKYGGRTGWSIRSLTGMNICSDGWKHSSLKDARLTIEKHVL